MAQKSNSNFEQEPSLINFAEIKWDAVEDAKAYFLEIYQDSKGKELLIARKLNKNYYHWQGAPAGTYYFRVAYEKNDDRKSPFSKLGRLIVEDIKDTDRFIELKYPKHKHTTFGERFGFEWKNVNQAEKYIVIIKDFQSKKLISKLETPTASMMTTLNPGLYRWQVFGVENDIEIALSEERFLKVADNKRSNFSKNDSSESLIKNYFVIESLPGQVQSDSEVTRSSQTYKNTDKLSLFPSSFRFSSLIKLQKDKFATSSIDYKSGNTGNVNFLSQVIISGSLNWTKKISESFVFFYGPSLRYDSLSLVSEDESANIGGSSLSYVSTGVNLGLIQYLDLAKSLTHQLLLEQQLSFMTVQGQTMIINYQIRKDKINFLKGFKSLYQNLYAQAGLKYSTQTAKSTDDSLQLTSLEFPIGIGFYID